MALAAAALVLSSTALADPVDRWSGDIAQASHRFGIPQSWIRRVIRLESGGRAVVAGVPIVSSAGAMGLMQLMPATWREMRVSLRLGADPFDPHDNILAGAAYLRLMYDRFGYPGLFAAYNGGPARYARYLGGGGELPLETRAYLARAAAEPAETLRPAPTPVRRPAARLFAVAALEPLSPRAPAALERAGGLFVDLHGPTDR